MKESDQNETKKKKVGEVKIFSVPVNLEEGNENLTINANTTSKTSQEQIINQAFKFHSQGNTQEAAKYYQQFINQGFKDHRVFSNYGVILKNLGKLQEAESSLRKAIKLKPEYAMAHYNLGKVLIN